MLRIYDTVSLKKVFTCSIINRIFNIAKHSSRYDSCYVRYSSMFFLLYTCFAPTLVISQDFKTISLYELLKTHPEIQYFKCHDAYAFNYKPFPLSIFPEQQPHQGLFAETFVTIIPNGQAYSQHGCVRYDGYVIEEFFSQVGTTAPHRHYAQEGMPKNDPVVYHGKVAVLTRIFANAFSHWTYDILARLVLIDMLNIEYDWLYVPYYLPFMKEMLTGWGVDPQKIIEPYEKTSYIQADQLIVPSIPYRRIHCGEAIFPENSGLASYIQPWIVPAFKEKYLPLIRDKNYNFSDKVFISRQHSGVRKIINEDEIFELFEPYGFKRYHLEDLSFLEQVALFHGAKAVIAAHGAGLTNLIFSDPHITMIEIFQERSDLTYFYLAQVLQLNYFYIPTCTFRYMLGHHDTVVNPLIIKNFIAAHENVFKKEATC